MEVKSFKQMRVVRIGGQLSAGLLFILLALSTVPFSFGSNNVEAETNSSVPSTITLTAANANATVTINPSDAGTFGTTSGNANIRFTITTSNSSGYTLTAKSSKTTLDRSGSGQLLSLASAVSQSQFSNASNTTLNNRWGYKPNYYNSSSNNNYRPAPSTSGVVLDKTTVANPTAKSYTIALGARINYDVPAGSYVNDTLELQYVANPVPYTITFDNNAPDDIVTNMPTNLTGSSSSPETITLPSRVPQRTNYTFVGWCTVQPTEVAGGQSCSGTTYSTSSQYGLDYTANNSSNTLYAIWTSSRGCNKAATTIGTGVTATDAVCMQDINDTVIASMTANAQHTLIDMRDGKSYFITKLVDGKVWMTQNLNYNLNTSTTLTHNNTDLGYETNDETKTWTPSRATLTNVANWSDDTSIPMSYDAGSWYYTSSGTTSADTASQVCSDSSTCGHFNAGTYYNWLAAIAENETNSNDHEMVPDSVCPAGWRLQDAYDEITYGELNYIFFQRGYVDEFVNSGNASLQSGALNAMRSAPLYIVRASRVTNGAISSNGTFASYWARTTKDSNSSYAPYINNTTMYAISSTNKGIGTSVRCIARMTTGTTSVAFHGNGATSGVDFTVTTDSGRAVSLHHTDSFVKPGYKITSWNTKADGSGNTYLDTSAMIVPATDTSTLNLFAQWEPSYNITYNGNGANSALTMTVGHNVLDGDNITLYAPNYFRTGYGFAGWSTTQINPDASNAATLMANAKIFGPNQTITANYETFGVNVPTSVTLYAVWVKSSGNMQDWKGCESLTATTREGDAFTPGSIIALTDTRDGDTYAIARLADGNCWMIENFRLDSTNSSDASKAQHFGDYFVGLANPEDIFTSDTTANSLYSTSNITGENIASRIPRYSNNNTNTTGQSASGAALTPDPSNSSIYHQWYGYGNMYNWPAAIADASDVGSTFTGIGTMTSICPSGWMLPVSSSTVTVDYSFMKLLNSVTGTSHTQLTASTNPTAATISSRFRTYPYNYVGSGYQSNSQVTGRGTNTYLWESASGTNHQYAAMFYVSPASVSGLSVLRTVGAAIRCVADKDYRIIYDGNGADAGHDMRITTPVSSGSPVTLAASNYVRSGYGFAGWSTTQINPDASNASTLIANATIYGPNESVTFENVTGNIKLYAVWIKPAGNLQDWSGCSSLAQGSVTALKDTRDNQVYTVAKLADGECWMIENLRLNDDHSADYSKMQGVGGVFSGLGDSTTNFGTSATTTVVIPSNTSLYTAYPRNTDLQYISGDYQQHRFPKYNNQNTALTVDHMMSLSQNVYSYGNYYNWPAAMANTSIMNTSNFSEYAGSSLCPAGWRLPTGGTAASGKDYNTLVTALNVPTNDSTNLRKYPNNFIYSGIYSSSNAQSQGTTGVYASSSANNDSSYYSLNFYDTSTQHSSTVATRQKVVGTVIRCIKDDRMEVILDANDGSGRFERVYGDSGFATSIPLAVAFMNDDSVVTSWNTKPDGSGTSYTTAYSGGTSTTLYAQWTSSYKIIYDGNNATSIPTMNAYGHSGIASGAKVLLYASNVLRDGYGFVGWSYTQIDPDSANAATQIANATIYGPNETITLPSSIPGDLVIYAVWAKSAGNMQDWTGCSSLADGGVTALKDTRDNQVYAVAKLADGNCWMIENLRLDSANSTDNTKAQGFGGVFAGLPNSELASFNSSMIANSLYTTDTASSSLNIIAGGDNLQYRIPRFNDASSGSISTLTANTQVAYSYGNYYNFAAIKANTGEMDTTATSEWSGTSICPKGWRLPTGGASGSGKEYESLNTAANSGSTTSSAGIRSYPNNFIYSGYIWSGAASARGQYGQYMSGSSNGGTGFFEYQFTSSAVNVGRSVFRSIGDSVRCIAKTGVTITLDSNDGSDKVAHVYVASGTAVTLSDVLFENENHSIASWNTSPSGTGTSYTTTITASSDVTLYAQWIPAYTIVYNGNNATGTTNMNLSRHTGVVDGDSIMLFSNNYIRDGYGFLGWSTTQIDPDASNASTLISNAKIWGPNQTIVANSTNLGVSTPANVTLYAVWVKATGTFQNWKGCSSLTTTTYNSSTGTITPGSFVALTDTRGTTANTYAIARLPGGNCWMIEDARFDLANDNITKLNTNNPTDTFLTNMRNTPSTCTSTAQSCVESTIYSEGNGLSRGIYYGWWTATAGNGAYNSNNSYDSDICPTGWHIPNGGSSASEFATLLSNIGASNANYTSTSSPTSMVLSARLRSFPLNFQYSGDTQGSNIYSYREQGYYNVGNGWANGSTYYRYYFGLSEDFVRVTYGWSKYMGFRLRCVYAPLIKYDGNGATSGSMTTVSRLATGASVTLRTSNFEKTGYGFLGWSPVADGSGPIYGQNETISASELSSHADAVGNVTMYAIWVQSTGNLQNWSGCDSLTKPTVNGVMTAKENVTALTDTRDNRTYTVARLADGNCYMNENLRLGASEISTDLTSGNTNVSTTVTAATFNGWRTTAATATATAGFVYTGFSNYEKNTINYNYCAATAGTICVDSTTESATYDICPAGWRLSTGGYMSGDIAGLYNLGYNTSALARKSVVNGGLGLTMNANVGASDISAQYLTSAAASASVYAPYLTSSVFSGTYQVSRSYHGPVRCVYDKPRVNLTVSYGSGVSSVTVNGSSVPSGRALRLDQGSTVTVVMYLKEDYAFNSWNTSGGTLGVSAQTTTFTLGTGTSASITGYASFTGTYIQNMSDTLCTTTARKVYDSRDMQSYYVKRLSDGNCWMVTNLNLGAVNFYNNLTSANSNLSTTVTYSTFNGWKKTASASTYTDGEFMVLTGNDATTGTPYGTLYNYYAATGGTISGDSNSTNATYDICPAGWRLPTGGNGNYEYYNLYNYYNSYSLMRASYNNGGAAFNQPGWFGGGASSTSNVNLGLSGSFWSSTTYNYNYRYGMYVATSGSTVQRDAPMIRNGGHSIRCIKKPDGVTLNVNYSRGVTAVYVNGNYIANGSSANVALGNSVSIIAYVKDGYSFYGWTVGKGSISSSSAYSTTYTAPSSSVTTTLNADARFLGTTIQGMPASYCTSTPRTVYDNRDDQAYTVARLKDGRCWMIDDLRLGYNTIYTDLTSTNTNLSSTITAATFSSWKNQAGSVSSGGFTTPSTGTDPTSGRAYGVTYNYYAASAGTISGDSNSSNATYDICPVGWRLPTGVSTTGDFAKLFAVYNTYSLIKSPVTDGGAAMNDYNSSSGVSEYWSSSYSSPTNMNVTYVTPSYQYPSFNTQRQYKNTIRCVMKNDSYNISNLTYLQDWNSLSSTNKTNVLSSMYDSVLYHLKDNRDNQTYDVAKLKDGHIWITQNLNLGSANISVNLTSANTNIASTVTSSTFNSWRKSSITPTLTSGELMYVNGTDSTSGTPYGVMYNYCAASGGTYCSSSSTANASYDLCPAGWRMPTSGMGSSYDIYNFGLNYQTAAQMFGPVTSGGAAFTLAGRATGGNLISYSGTYGDYWSSNNSGSTTWMKTWNFNSSSVADAQANRGYAINVRCIGK